MIFLKRGFSLQALASAVLVLAGSAHGVASNLEKDTASPVADPSLAQLHYRKLTEQGDASATKCLPNPRSPDRVVKALERFIQRTRFIEVSPGKPITVELPDDYYHPQGRTLTFDEFSLVVNVENPTEPYMTMTRTAEGVVVEPKNILHKHDGSFICVMYLRVTLPFMRAE